MSLDDPTDTNGAPSQSDFRRMRRSNNAATGVTAAGSRAILALLNKSCFSCAMSVFSNVIAKASRSLSQINHSQGPSLEDTRGVPLLLMVGGLFRKQVLPPLLATVYRFSEPFTIYLRNLPTVCFCFSRHVCAWLRNGRNIKLGSSPFECLTENIQEP